MPNLLSVITMTGDSTYTLELSGDAGLRNVQDIANMLRTALENHGSITIAAEDMTSIDVTILQLLVAARKSALASGKTLTLRAPKEGVLHRLLVQTGFVGTDGKSRTPEGAFWTAPISTEHAA